MLILSRRIGETLVIGDDITITILNIAGNQMKLGITAPREVPVHREELYKKLKSEGAEKLVFSQKEGNPNKEYAQKVFKKAFKMVI